MDKFKRTLGFYTIAFFETFCKHKLKLKAAMNLDVCNSEFKPKFSFGVV